MRAIKWVWVLAEMGYIKTCQYAYGTHLTHRRKGKMAAVKCLGWWVKITARPRTTVRCTKGDHCMRGYRPWALRKRKMLICLWPSSYATHNVFDFFHIHIFRLLNRNTSFHCFVEQWNVLKRNRFPDSVEVSVNLLHVAPFITSLYK